MTNQLTVTLVVVFLGALALLSLGALAGILASTHVAQSPAQIEVVRAGPAAPVE